MARFKPGQSGNPAGKPRGAKHATTKLREAIAGDLHAIVAALIEKARDGDVGAASLLFSRTLPPLRPTIDTPDTPLPGVTLGERAEAITAAALAGQLTPDAAHVLMGIVEKQAKIIEASELEARIAALEEKHR